MAEMSQLENALLKADAAGDTESARALAGEIRRMRQQPIEDDITRGARESMKPTALERFGRGAADVVQGGKQLFFRAVGDTKRADDYSAQVADEMQRYEKGRGEDAGFDWMRLGGNVAATTPLMLVPGGAAASAPVRYGSIAAQGAAGAALNPVDETKGDFWTQKAMQTGIGAAAAPVAAFGVQKGAEIVGNKILRPAKDFISATAKKMGGEMPNTNAVFNSDGTLTSKGAAAMKNLGLSFDDLTDEVRGRLQQVAADSTKEARALTPEQQLRATLFRDVTGEDATLGQVTRDFAQQQTEQELKKANSVGGPLRARFARQNQGLLNAVEDVRSGTGAAAPTEYQAGQKVSESIRSSDKEAREAVSMLYKAVDQEYGGQFAIKPNGLLSKLDEISDNAEADPLVTSVTRRLTRLGLLNDKGTIKRGASLNASQADELRKFVGGMSSSTPNARRMIAGLVESLDDDVRASAGEDVYNIARQVAKTRFEDLRIPAVRAIVDGDVPAEQVFDKYVRRGSIDDLSALKGYMARGGEDNHGLTPAWNELRGQTIAEVFDRATKNSAKDELDNVILSGAQFKKALFGRDGIGEDKLRVLFTPEEIAKLERITKVAEWRIPMADAVNHSNTSSAMWNMVDRILSFLPGKSGLVMRGAGRAAQIGAREIEQEAAANAAMVPGQTLAKRAEEAAAEKTAQAVRKGSNLLRAPSFFSMGAERSRNR